MYPTLKLFIAFFLEGGMTEKCNWHWVFFFLVYIINQGKKGFFEFFIYLKKIFYYTLVPLGAGCNRSTITVDLVVFIRPLVAMAIELHPAIAPGGRSSDGGRRMLHRFQMA